MPYDWIPKNNGKKKHAPFHLNPSIAETIFCSARFYVIICKELVGVGEKEKVIESTSRLAFSGKIVEQANIVIISWFFTEIWGKF